MPSSNSYNPLNIQEKSFLNFKRTSPVSNPDRGSHYLKKSPSPTGLKSPPGCEPNNETSLSPCEEYINRRPLVPSPQVNTWFWLVDCKQYWSLIGQFHIVSMQQRRWMRALHFGRKLFTLNNKISPLYEISRCWHFQHKENFINF